jgi:tRNA A-37 threonylcarbamoyl transferase component Bud32
MKMKAALRRIHDAGFVHGDIASRNFCTTESGDVVLMDLERCQPSGNPSEQGIEMNEVDSRSNCHLHREFGFLRGMNR